MQKTHIPLTTLTRSYTITKLVCDQFLDRVPDAIEQANIYRKTFNMPLYIPPNKDLSNMLNNVTLFNTK